SFILTKWYVNIFLQSSSILKAPRFILTKWYVNEEMFNMMKNGAESFILTKWYVNKSHRPPHDTIIIVLY
ncbi:hypothetical protein, partial [Clostridioides difficile]|uniref:hypothetical protein n=1 Tax=Clostridioides difficile TaxID=1496 RepID=UPI003AA7F449